MVTVYVNITVLDTINAVDDDDDDDDEADWHRQGGPETKRKQRIWNHEKTVSQVTQLHCRSPSSY